MNNANKNRRVMAKFAQFVNIDNKPVYVNTNSVDSFGPEIYGDTIVIAIHTKTGNSIYVKNELQEVVNTLNTVEEPALLND